MKPFCKISSLLIVIALGLVLRADYRFSAITNSSTGATATTVLVPDGSSIVTSIILTNCVQDVVADTSSSILNAAKEYTDNAIAESGGGSGVNLKIATGAYLSHIEMAPLYDGNTNGSSQVDGCWLTNIVLNTNNGDPVSLTAHLNGTICGRAFNNEEIGLTTNSAGIATAIIEDESGKYTLTYNTSIPSDVSAYPYRGYFEVAKESPYTFVTWYSFTDCRAFKTIVSEVDSTPNAAHDRSLVTSKGVYDATSSKLDKSGGTLDGTLYFSTLNLDSQDDWRVPKWQTSGAKTYTTGTIKNPSANEEYSASLSVGQKGWMGTAIKYPVGMTLDKFHGNTSAFSGERLHYTLTGIEQETYSYSGGVLVTNDYLLGFPKNSDGSLLEGTVARVEDLAVTNSINTAIANIDEKATAATNSIHNLIMSGLKSPNQINIKANGAQISSYNGEYERNLNFGEGLSVSINDATTTVIVDSTKYATPEALAADKIDLENAIKVLDEKPIDKLYALSTVPADTVTAVYVISNPTTHASYKVAVSTINGVWATGGASFLQIENPSPDGGTARGWMKAEMSITSNSLTNWNLYVSVGATQPSSWALEYSVVINTSSPIFPMAIGEEMTTYNTAYVVRKVNQFRGTASGYLSGDCGLYSITGDMTNSVATVSNMVDAIEAAVSPVRTTANSASSGVNSLNGRMTSVETTIGNLKEVATSGKYSDLTGKPTNVSDFTNDAGYVTANEINPKIDDSFAYTTAISNEVVVVNSRISAISNKVNAANTRIDNSFDYTTSVSNKVFGSNEVYIVTNNQIAYKEGVVNFTYTAGTFSVDSTDWLNYKPVFIIGSIAAGVTFDTNIRFNGFVEDNGTIKSVSASTIPLGTIWYGYLRKIDELYYIEYIGTYESTEP